MTTEDKVSLRASPQFSISCRLSMAVSPEAAKLAILASSWFCPESAFHVKKIQTDRLR